MTPDNPILLSSTFFGPIQYFTKFFSGQPVLIEQNDFYLKQTYRNRCTIITGNGPVALSIPVVKTNGNKTLLKDIRIFNDENWQRIHLRALKSAYQNSPFYEYYIDELMPAFEKKWDFLVDLNCFTVDVIAQEIETPLPYQRTNAYFENSEPEMDFRNSISPKEKDQLPDPAFRPHTYHQVFWDRFSFEPNLSILDLLFNKGPETADFLAKCTNPKKG